MKNENIRVKLNVLTQKKKFGEKTAVVWPSAIFEKIQQYHKVPLLQLHTRLTINFIILQWNLHTNTKLNIFNIKTTLIYIHKFINIIIFVGTYLPHTCLLTICKCLFNLLALILFLDFLFLKNNNICKDLFFYLHFQYLVLNLKFSFVSLYVAI